MKKLKFNELRKEWLDFFKSKSHVEFESQSLIPKNDNSLLWINSGVATLKKYFSGKENPSSTRIVNSQRCIRTNDIENVGVTSRHHTLFEMLGNFSIGDYFKEEAIEFAFEFLTKKLEMEIEKLYITVYEEDEVTLKKWESLGIIKTHIIKCNKDRNFWDLGSGPCGPCTEIYFDRGEKYDPNKIGEKLFFEDIENDRYVEIWNIVFSEFNNINGEYSKLERKNIDTGAGLERLASIIQDAPTDFDTDGFIPIINSISNYTPHKYDINSYFKNDVEQNKINKNYRIIVDHLKACSFAIADGAIPSNKDRGYIIRKLIRRAKLSMYFLDIQTNECVEEVISKIINVMKPYYPYLKENKEKIISTILLEMNSFQKTLIRSEALFKESISKKVIDGKTLFNLVDTYGLPIEVIREIQDNLLYLSKIFTFTEEEKSILKKGIDIEFDKFDKYFEEHKKISKNNNQEDLFEIQNAALMKLNTKMTFYHDTYELKGKVVKIYDKNFNEVDSIKNQECYIVLNKTCFYATSGGQLCDKGKINGYDVVDVFLAPKRQHVIKIEKGTFKLNDVVTQLLDVSRRQKTAINHSCEHLLHAALRNLIDSNIKQEGAFKSKDKFTFDFQLSRKLTDEELQNLEDWVNNQVKKGLDVSDEFMTLEESKKEGIIGYFDEVYEKINEPLRVVNIGGVSRELCGGTHVPNTKYISMFKIVKYESKGSGSWRLECITTEQNILFYIKEILWEMTEHIQNRFDAIKEYKTTAAKYIDSIQTEFKKFSSLVRDDPLVNINEIRLQYERIIKLCNDCIKEGEKEIELKSIAHIKESLMKSDSYISYCTLKDFPQKAIQNALLEIINEVKDKSFFVFNETDEKIQYFGAQNDELKSRNILNIIKKFNSISEGKGGGKQNFAQGGTSNIDSLNKMISILEGLCKN